VDVLPPRTGELLGDSADRRVELLCDDDALHATWSRFGPGRDGADLHVHYHHSDLFYVLEGELTLRLGVEDRSVVAPVGSLVHVPPLVVHGFRNAGDTELRYLNFHAPGSGFADYMRARRDGLPASTDQASFDQEDPPADGSRSPEAARIGEATLVVDEIEIHERRLEPGAALQSSTARRLLCLYVLEGSLALADGVRAEAGAWVRLSEPLALACAGPEPAAFLEIHV
jgi:mannose-6-phosphate isomerase-like protein (cupin superfamily)